MTSQPRRRTLAERNRDAIIRDPHPESTQLPERRARTTTTDTTTQSVSMTQAEYNDVKAAFLADWQNNRQHDTLPSWVGAAIERHAHLTPAQRSDLNGSGPKGNSPRSFNIANIVSDAISDTMTADAAAGIFLTRSGWCHNALSVAVSTARDTNGGTLPTAPTRLPIRLA